MKEVSFTDMCYSQEVSHCIQDLPLNFQVISEGAKTPILASLALLVLQYIQVLGQTTSLCAMCEFQITALYCITNRYLREYGIQDQDSHTLFGAFLEKFG